MIGVEFKDLANGEFLTTLERVPEAQEIPDWLRGKLTSLTMNGKILKMQGVLENEEEDDKLLGWVRETVLKNGGAGIVQVGREEEDDGMIRVWTEVTIYEKPKSAPLAVLSFDYYFSLNPEAFQGVVIENINGRLFEGEEPQDLMQYPTIAEAFKQTPPGRTTVAAKLYKGGLLVCRWL